MKQALIVIVILVVAGLAYWFFIKDTQTLSNSPTTDKQELVPPALPE